MNLALTLLLAACGGDALTAPDNSDDSLAATPTRTLPGQVTDLAVAAATDTSLTVRFTEVDDGTGQPAEYDVRFAAPDISWGSATSVTEGSCTPPVPGEGVGSIRECDVGDLDPETTYDVQLVAYREDSTGRTYGDLSNVVGDTTDVANATSTPDDSASSDTTSNEGGDGSGPYPNEPLGFERIAEHDLSCIPGTTLCSAEAGSWSVDESRLDLISTVSSVTGLLTDDEVVEITFPSGFDDGYAPARFDGWGPSLSWAGEDDVDEVYVSFWLKVRGPDYQNQSGGTKILYMAYGSTTRQNHSFFVLKGNGDQSVMSSMPLTYYVSEMRADGTDPGGGARTYYPNQAGAPEFTVGEWHQVELWMKINDIDPTAANGEVRWWLDGQLVAHHTGFRFRSDLNPEGFYHLEVTPVYGGNSGDVRTREDHWLMDDLYISTRP